MNERPKWEHWDSVRSIRDFGKLILEWIDRKDTELANAINGEEDEYEQSGSGQAQSG